MLHFKVYVIICGQVEPTYLQACLDNKVCIRIITLRSEMKKINSYILCTYAA